MGPTSKGREGRGRERGKKLQERVREGKWRWRDWGIASWLLGDGRPWEGEGKGEWKGRERRKVEDPPMSEVRWRQWTLETHKCVWKVAYLEIWTAGARGYISNVIHFQKCSNFNAIFSHEKLVQNNFFHLQGDGARAKSSKYAPMCEVGHCHLKQISYR